MNLRRTTILSIVITFLMLSVVLAISLQLVFSRHFQNEESQQSILNMQRVQSRFDNQFTILNYLAVEWARLIALWDLPAEPVLEEMRLSLADQQVDVWLIVDGDGALWQSGGNAENDGVDAQTFWAALQERAALFAFEEGVQRKHGILIVQKVPWLVSVAEIPEGAGEGLTGGKLLLGWVFDDGEIQQLAEQVRFPIRVGLLDGDGEPDFQAARDYFQAGNETIYLERVSETNLAGYVLMNDLLQEPALILRADQYRFVARNAALVMRSMLIALGAAALVFAVFFFGLIERTMLTRLQRLDQEVQAITAQPGWGKKVTVDRKDEISSVSANINQMMEALEDNQQERFEELSVLLKVSQLFLEQKSLAEVRDVLCALAKEHFGALVVWLGEATGDEKMVPVAAAGKAVEEIDAVTLVEDSIHQYMLTPVFETSSLELYGKVEDEDIFYVVVLPLNWGMNQQALYLCMPEKPNLDEQDQQYLASFGSLSELVLGNTQLLAKVKSSQKSLQELSRRLVRVHEEERRNLARELHDEIGQNLTALKLQCKRMEKNGEGGDVEIAGAQDLLNELIRRVRKMSLDLRPGVLDDLGLLPALAWYFERYTHQTGIAVDFDPQLPEGRRFSSEIELSLYRIVQESLTNVARHAGVKSVLVELKIIGEEIELIIEDEGVGFAPEEQKAGSSSGLTGMAERARLLQGEMGIHSQPGTGTLIAVRLPLEGEVEADQDSAGG